MDNHEKRLKDLAHTIWHQGIHLVNGIDWSDKAMPMIAYHMYKNRRLRLPYLEAHDVIMEEGERKAESYELGLVHDLLESLHDYPGMVWDGGWIRFSHLEDQYRLVSHYVANEMLWGILYDEDHEELLGCLKSTAELGEGMKRVPSFSELALLYYKGKTGIVDDIRRLMELLKVIHDNQLSHLTFDQIDFRGVYIGDILFADHDSHGFFRQCLFDSDCFIVNRGVDFEDELYEFQTINGKVLVKNTVEEQIFEIDVESESLLPYGSQYAAYEVYDEGHDHWQVAVPDLKSESWIRSDWSPIDEGYLVHSGDDKHLVRHHNLSLQVMDRTEGVVRSLGLCSRPLFRRYFYTMEGEDYFITRLDQDTIVIRSYDMTYQWVVRLGAYMDDIVRGADWRFELTMKRYLTWQIRSMASKRSGVMVLDLDERMIICRFKIKVTNGIFWAVGQDVYMFYKHRLFKRIGQKLIGVVDLMEEVHLNGFCNHFVMGHQLYVHNTMWIVIIDYVQEEILKVIAFDNRQRGTYIGENVLCHDGTLYQIEQDGLSPVTSYHKVESMRDIYDLKRIETLKAVVVVGNTGLGRWNHQVDEDRIPDHLRYQVIAPMLPLLGRDQGIHVFRDGPLYVIFYPHELGGENHAKGVFEGDYYDNLRQQLTDQYNHVDWCDSDGVVHKRRRTRVIEGILYYDPVNQRFFNRTTYGSFIVGYLDKERLQQCFYISGDVGSFIGCTFDDCEDSSHIIQELGR